MMTLTPRLQPHLDVVDTELEGDETVLLHLESKLYYSLNRTGTRVWNGIKQKLSLKTISDHLQEEFVVEADQADASVLALADDLGRQHLVVAVDGDTGLMKPSESV
jgi:hypothetical protein